MLESEIIPASGEHSATVVWLHGLGASGHDFVPMAQHMALPGVRWVFPHAPKQPVALNGGVEMPAWFDISAISAQAPQDYTGMIRMEAQLQALLQQEFAQAQANSLRVFLGGFSQGAAMALFLGLRHSTPTLAGLMACSGYVPLPDLWQQGLPDGVWPPTVFMAHGVHDEVVPETFGAQGCALLRQAGCDVRWHTYGMRHEVCAQQIADLRAFIIERSALAEHV